MKKSIYVLIILILLFSFVSCGHNRSSVPDIQNNRAPIVGRFAPDLEVGEFVGSRSTKSDMFKGKDVFLVFWSTCCDVTEEALPYINNLAYQFNSDKMVIALVSKEPKKTVEDFIKNRDLDAVVFIDKDSRTFESFGAGSIPDAFLIDKKGIIKWHGHPLAFHETMMTNYLKTGKVIQTKQRRTFRT
jgi:peroxiredoxin